MPATFHSPSQIAFSDQILEAAPCGILVYHANGRCLKANPAAAGMVGASVAQLLQQNFRAIDSWRKAGLDLLAEKTLATGELQQGEFNCATTFGLELWANCKFTRLCHDAQYFLVLFFEDCSAQRRAEAELQARREMLRHVINNLPAFVFVTDREHRYTLVNTAYCRYLGREAERILGATHHDFYPRETADRFCQTNGEIMTKGITIKQNEAVGSRIMLSVKSPLHNSDGEVVGLCGVVSDITEERYQEEAKRQDQRLEAVAHLAGGLAHEFNNLLSGIQLNLELIRQDLPLPVDDDPVVESENLCLRAANLVRELLAYSHRSLIRPEILDLEELTATHLDAIRIMAGGKITVNLASQGDRFMVRADPALIAQAIMGLCRNACEAMPAGGRLTIYLSNHLGSSDLNHPATEVVRLSVTDTGKGMDESTRMRLFEPFFTTKGVGQGTGMSLASTRGIVQQHGGWMEVETHPQIGSTFSILLPALAP